MRILMLVSALVSLNGYAADDWLCTSQASLVEGSRILACGVGEAATESGARARAFDSAREEFARLCGPGTVCEEQKHVIEPKRTTCAASSEGWKCYRLLVYRLATGSAAAPHIRKLPKEHCKRVSVAQQNDDLIDSMFDQALVKALGRLQ